MALKILELCTEEQLTAAYETWCKKKGYPFIDANELFHDLIGREKRPEKDIAWLAEFIDHWDAVMYRQSIEKKPKIPVQAHWASELSKLRCWIAGFKMARNNDFPSAIPGEDTLRQIEVAIREGAGE